MSGLLVAALLAIGAAAATDRATAPATARASTPANTLATFHRPAQLRALPLSFVSASSVQPSDSARCAAAARFLRTEPRTALTIDRDTIDDWRTGRRLPGCRVTAAGITRLGVQGEAVRFYERLRAAGWTRTPDPRDSPNEASLRFRQDGTDCVFNVYGDARLGTEAEFRVNDSVTAGAGETRYQVLVLCMPALPAAPRDTTGAAPRR